MHLVFEGVPMESPSSKKLRVLIYGLYRVVLELDNAGFADRSYGSNLPSLLPMK